MLSKTTVLFLTFTVLTAALPANLDRRQNSFCGNGQTAACCNTSDGGDNLLDLLSGDCALLVGSGTCSSNNVFCCQTEQTVLRSFHGI